MNQRVESFLTKMGLTEYEAKVMGTLFRLKEADSPLVASESGVPKTRVYDVLGGLIQKGLAVEVATRPKKYRAMSPQESFNKLVGERQNQLDTLQTEAKEWITQLKQPENQAASIEEKILKVKSRTDFYKILAQEIDSTNERITGLTRLDMHHHLLHHALQKAATRNVKIRLAGEHPEEFKEKMQKVDNIELQDAKHGLHAYVMDGKKVVMLLSDMKQEKPEYHFAIWPENTPLARALEQTFDTNWEK
ncbi:MAG: helix-turn-helix domain-containing protein [Candidatus Diapherotrites archaeon]